VPLRIIILFFSLMNHRRSLQHNFRYSQEESQDLQIDRSTMTPTTAQPFIEQNASGLVIIHNFIDDTECQCLAEKSWVPREAPLGTPTLAQMVRSTSMSDAVLLVAFLPQSCSVLSCGVWLSQYRHHPMFHLLLVPSVRLLNAGMCPALMLLSRQEISCTPVSLIASAKKRLESTKICHTIVATFRAVRFWNAGQFLLVSSSPMCFKSDAFQLDVMWAYPRVPALAEPCRGADHDHIHGDFLWSRYNLQNHPHLRDCSTSIQQSYKKIGSSVVHSTSDMPQLAISTSNSISESPGWRQGCWYMPYHRLGWWWCR
jgi:hypothetical protein